jgi:hypothetical protein
MAKFNTKSAADQKVTNLAVRGSDPQGEPGC